VLGETIDSNVTQWSDNSVGLNVHRESKNMTPNVCPCLRHVLTDFQNSLTHTLSRKFAIKGSLTIPPCLKRIATLHYEILMSDNKHAGALSCWNMNSPETWGTAGSNCTVIGSIEFESQIDEYQTNVAQFRHPICHRQRLTERLSCAKKAFCAEVFIFRCRRWIQ